MIKDQQEDKSHAIDISKVSIELTDNERRFIGESSKGQREFRQVDESFLGSLAESKELPTDRILEEA
jgi:hypothetical protein